MALNSRAAHGRQPLKRRRGRLGWRGPARPVCAVCWRPQLRLRQLQQLLLPRGYSTWRLWLVDGASNRCFLMCGNWLLAVVVLVLVVMLLPALVGVVPVLRSLLPPRR
jgi:hypothetical protein